MTGLARVALPLVLAAAATAPASAADLLYQNGFETTDNNPAWADASLSGGFYFYQNVAPATGQFFAGNDVGIQVEGADPADPVGSQYAFVGNGAAFSNIGTDQVLGSATPYLSYTFTVALGIRSFGLEPNGNLNNQLADITIGIEDRTGTTALQTLTFKRGLLNSTAFQDFSVTLPAATVAAGDEFRLFVDKLPGQADSNAVTLIVADNFRVTGNPIPEPASLALLGLGATLIVSRRRNV